MSKYVTGIAPLVNKLNRLGRGLSREEADRVGSAALQAMKELISKGISPVRGGDASVRFPRYKNPKNYPGTRKSKTPVNLFLTGDFLKDLTYRVVSRAVGFAAEIGYSSETEKAKEKGHRDGANGQPKRPTIPVFTKGERFARTIEDAYLRVVLPVIRRKTE